MGLMTYAYPAGRIDLERATQALPHSSRAADARARARGALGVHSAISPNERLQQLCHPWTSYVIVPLFALANAGIHDRHGFIATRTPRRSRSESSSPTWWASRSGSRAPPGSSTLSGLRLPPTSAGPVGAGVTRASASRSPSWSRPCLHGRELEEAKLAVLAAATAPRLAWLVASVIRSSPTTCDRASSRARQKRSWISPCPSTLSAITSAATTTRR